jgi:negative regulator of sigma E activity
MTRLDDAANNSVTDAMQERLNAYLDGELPADEARAVEERLSSDPAWAAELQRLERAWNLLDQLPRSEPTPNFMQTTVEMIALQAEEDLQATVRPKPRRRWMDYGMIAAGALAAALAGYLTIAHLRPQRDDAMLHELPVLRHLELYGRTDPGESAEFLRLLRREPPLTPIPPRDGR